MSTFPNRRAAATVRAFETHMPAPSTRAVEILQRMEPDLGYGLQELRQFAPDLSLEALRELMRELWIERQVERFGYSGWRRVRAVSGRHEASGGPSAGPVKLVKPEELFDHDSFSGFFK